MLELQERSTRATVAHWEPDWLRDTSTKSPQPVEEKELTTDLVQDSGMPFDADYSEFYWSCIYPHDFAYLTAPRDYPGPCVWCGGRLHHNRLCDELRHSWQAEMPFGKHKGRKLADVPRDYLQWFASCDGIDADLVNAVRLHLETEE
jgi:uncharacterized protein (DUF3820 family)